MLIRRLLFRNLSGSVALLLLIFVSLFLFFDLLRELENVGNKSYTFVKALQYVSLLTPTYIYEIAPIAFLIGTITVLVRWQANSEFTVLRASGFSVRQALYALLLFGVIAAAGIVAIGEWLAPLTWQKALKTRVQAQEEVYSNKFISGIWVKDKSDTVVNIVNIKRYASEQVIEGVTFFRIDNKIDLKTVLRAERGVYLGDKRWRLENITRTDFVSDVNVPNPVQEKKKQNFDIQTNITPNILSAFYLEPERMSLQHLYTTIRHLESAGQENSRYKMSFWKRIAYPFSLLVMLLVALPFAYLHTRSKAMGEKIFGGVILGLSFLIFSTLLHQFAFLNNWYAALPAFLPSVVYGACSAVFLWRLQVK